MAARIEDGEGTSPTWGDVAELIEHVEQKHKCKVLIEMGRVTTRKRAIVIDVVAKRVRGRSDWYTCRYTGGQWPTYRVKTMPALLVRLVWLLSDAMHDFDELPIFRDIMPEAELPPPPA